MPKNFADRLIEAVLAKRSQVCVGLDPRLDHMPPSLLARYAQEQGEENGRREIGACLEEFGAAIIEAVAPEVVAIKLQLACFEQYGPPGIRAFQRLCRRAAGAGLLVIADAKRGDIGISAQAYSAAFIGRPDGLDGKIDGYGADAMTVNPLFGSDGIEPFLDDCRSYGRGIFVLVRTSNPGAAEIQDLQVDGSGSVYQHIAGLVAGWGGRLRGDGGYSSVGAVIGANGGGAISGLRELLPRVFFLMPGYGAQGAGTDDVAPAFDSRGLGALITASRSIIYAGSGDDYAAAAAAAAAGMREELWQTGGGQA
ncbi:MAG TPA: orotidine-5'-phosphate decarboxylase [Actinobacteria bacterium]|nr:orotidine-5'-phosphate decarboxylase [Actinomycetota bacterium]